MDLARRRLSSKSRHSTTDNSKLMFRHKDEYVDNTCSISPIIIEDVFHPRTPQQPKEAIPRTSGRKPASPVPCRISSLSPSSFCSFLQQGCPVTFVFSACFCDLLKGDSTGVQLLESLHYRDFHHSLLAEYRSTF